MNITVIGAGHLAYITAAGMESYHKVNVDLKLVKNSDLIWFCYDTPVNSQGEPDNTFIKNSIIEVLSKTEVNCKHILISSQIVVGTCESLQQIFPNFYFSYSPENLRRGKALDCFLRPDRIVIGAHTDSRDILKKLFEPIIKSSNSEILFMSVRSAEMVKHALNAFLALSISFINEIDTICKAVNADSNDVANGLQSDVRIGKLSYLKPGAPYTNDTLGREIHNLINLKKEYILNNVHIIPAIKESNNARNNNR